MTWRLHKDESNFTNAQKVAWEIVMPLYYLPLLDDDYRRADALSKDLVRLFSPQALASAAKRIKRKPEHST